MEFLDICFCMFVRPSMLSVFIFYISIIFKVICYFHFVVASEINMSDQSVLTTLEPVSITSYSELSSESLPYSVIIDCSCLNSGNTIVSSDLSTISCNAGGSIIGNVAEQVCCQSIANIDEDFAFNSEKLLFSYSTINVEVGFYIMCGSV